MANTTAMKRGWNWNVSNSSLDAMVNGRDIFQLYSTSTSQRLKLSGDIRARPERNDALRREPWKRGNRVGLIRVWPFVLKHEQGNLSLWRG